MSAASVGALVVDVFSDVENFKRMLHNQLPPTAQDGPYDVVQWESELRKKMRGTEVIEEVVIRIRGQNNIGFVFDSATGRLKYPYRW